MALTSPAQIDITIDVTPASLPFITSLINRKSLHQVIRR